MKYVVAASALIASACGAPVELHTEYTRTGAQSVDQELTPVVQAPHEVRIYYKAGPPGFSLRENELKVEEGYGHRILGELKVRAEDDDDRSCAREHAPSQKDVFSELQTKAYEIGANAVIYAYSEVSQRGNEKDCRLAVETNEFGGAWAVLVSPEHLAPAGPPDASGERPGTACAVWRQRIKEAPNGQGKVDVIREAPPECLGDQ